MAFHIPTIFTKIIAKIPSFLGQKISEGFQIQIAIFFLRFFNRNMVKTRRTAERPTVLSS